MPDFARDPGIASVNLMVENQPTGDGRANFEVDDIALIPSGSIAALTQRSHVAIVIQIDQHTQLVLQRLLNIDIGPACQRGWQRCLLRKRGERADNPQANPYNHVPGHLLLSYEDLEQFAQQGQPLFWSLAQRKGHFQVLPGLATEIRQHNAEMLRSQRAPQNVAGARVECEQIGPAIITHPMLFLEHNTLSYQIVNNVSNRRSREAGVRSKI